MGCFGPIELATCPYCGPHAGLRVSNDTVLRCYILDFRNNYIIDL